VFCQLLSLYNKVLIIIIY